MRETERERACVAYFSFYSLRELALQKWLKFMQTIMYSHINYIHKHPKMVRKLIKCDRIHTRVFAVRCVYTLKLPENQLCRNCDCDFNFKFYVCTCTSMWMKIVQFQTIAECDLHVECFYRSTWNSEHDIHSTQIYSPVIQTYQFTTSTKPPQTKLFWPNICQQHSIVFPFHVIMIFFREKILDNFVVTSIKI